jgi:hypothetical protein
VGDDLNAMARVLVVGDLTDTHGHQHGEINIKTYRRGHERLDYGLVTPRMVDHILRSGYEAFHARTVSDHRDYFVDFALAGFLDRQLPAIFSATSQAIRGTHPSNIPKYVEHLHKYLETNNIYRLAKVQKNWYETKKLEKIDGVLRVQLGYFERARYLALGKFLFKLLRTEMENYHIIMTMGLYRIEPTWISICLIHTY